MADTVAEPYVRVSFRTLILTGLLIFTFIFSPLSITQKACSVDTPSRFAQFYISKNIAIADANDGISVTSPFTCVEMISGPGGIQLPSIHFNHCVGELSYGLFIVASYFMTATGVLFDIMLNFGLNQKVMDQKFIKDAWTAIRDLVNMAFIFVLIYIAIATILDISKHNAKSTLVKLIIAALLINFSLFFSRTIIDAGNISALFFYDAITVNGTTNLAGDAQNALNMQSYLLPSDRDIKGVSLAIMSTINPQQILIEQGTNRKIATDADANIVWKLIFLFIASTVLVAFMGVTFLQTAFLFLSRIAVLWILMAFSPFMFAGTAFPPSHQYASKLWKELGGKAFCITIFLFFVWLTVLFATPGGSQDLFVKDTSNLNFLQFVVVLALKFGTIIILLNYGKNLTKKRCESFDGTSFSFAGKLLGGVGAVAGLAIGGGIGMAGRKLLGGAAARTLNTVGADGMTKRQSLASGNAFDRLRLRTLEAGEKGTYDARNTRLGQTVGSKVFQTDQKGVSAIGSFGQRKAGQGFTADVEQETKKRSEYLKKLGKLDDKDPEKAKAAKLAYERYEKQMAKVPDTLSQSEMGSPYHETLKRMRDGKVSDLTEEQQKWAGKQAEEIEKNTLQARAEIAERYGDSPKNIGKVRAAEEARKALESDTKKKEKEATAKENKEKDTASYEKYRSNFDGYAASNDEMFRGIFVAPMNGTMSGYKSAAEDALVELNKKAATIASEIKRATMQQEAAARKQAQFSTAALSQTNNALRTGLEKAAATAQGEYESALRTIKTQDGALAEVNSRINEMKEFGKKIGTMERYLKDDLTDLRKPAPASPAAAKTDDAKK